MLSSSQSYLLGYPESYIFGSFPGVIRDGIQKHGISPRVSLVTNFKYADFSLVGPYIVIGHGKIQAR